MNSNIRHARANTHLSSRYIAEPFQLSDYITRTTKNISPLADNLFDKEDLDSSSCLGLYSNEDLRRLGALLLAMSQEESALFLRNNSCDSQNG